MLPSCTVMEEEGVYRRILRKDVPKYFYLNVTMVFDESAENEPDIDEFQFKITVVKAMEGLFGEAGTAIPFDVIKYDSSCKEGLLRVLKRGLVQLWSSLTLFGVYQGHDCAFHVKKVSSFLPAMGTNSRTFIHGQDS